MYDKNKCIFCQGDSGDESCLHNVDSASMGKRIIHILENSTHPIYNVIRTTFTDDLDVQAHDTKYHLRCLVEQEGERVYDTYQ